MRKKILINQKKLIIYVFILKNLKKIVNENYNYLDRNV